MPFFAAFKHDHAMVDRDVIMGINALINKTKKVLGTGYTNCLIMHLFAVAAVKQVDMTLRKQPYDNATFRFLKDKARRELSRWRAMHTSNILNRVNFFTPERKDAIVAGAKFFAQWWVNEHLQLLANDSTEKRWGTDSQISQSRYLSQEDLMHDGEYQHHNSPSLKRASCDGMNDVEHKAKMQLVEFKRQVPAPPPQTGVDEDCEMSDDGDEPFAPPQIQPAQSQTQPTASQAQTSSSDDEDVEMSDDSQDVPDLSSMPSLNINGNKAAAPAAFTADQGKIGFMKQMAKTSPRRSMDSGIGVRYGYEVKNTPAFPQEETQKASRAGTGPAKASTPVTPTTSTSSGNRQAEQHETINSSNKLSQPRADSMEPSSGYKDQFTSDGQSAAMGGSTQMPSCNGLTGLAAKQATVEDADESENEMNGADQGQRASVNIPQPTPADSHVERTDNGSGGVPATKYMAARVDEVSEDELEDYVDDVDEEIADAPEPVQYAAFTRNPTIPRGIDLSTVRVGLDNLTPIVAPTNSSGSRPTIPQQNAQTSSVQGFGAGADSASNSMAQLPRSMPELALSNGKRKRVDERDGPKATGHDFEDESFVLFEKKTRLDEAGCASYHARANQLLSQQYSPSDEPTQQAGSCLEDRRILPLRPKMLSSPRTDFSSTLSAKNTTGHRDPKDNGISTQPDASQDDIQAVFDNYQEGVATMDDGPKVNVEAAENDMRAMMKNAMSRWRKTKPAKDIGAAADDKSVGCANHEARNIGPNRTALTKIAERDVQALQSLDQATLDAIKGRSSSTGKAPLSTEGDIDETVLEGEGLMKWKVSSTARNKMRFSNDIGKTEEEKRRSIFAMFGGCL